MPTCLTTGSEGSRKTTPSRSEEGLPETGFVFASFNSLHKFGPEIFDIWMRLLKAVEGSVLWMPGAELAASANLRREAAAKWRRAGALDLCALPQKQRRSSRQATSGRPFPRHPALQCAFHGRRCAMGGFAGVDLHGPSLPGPGGGRPAARDRPAGNDNHALPAEYEQRALALARDPARLAAIREKLARNRDTTPHCSTWRPSPVAWSRSTRPCGNASKRACRRKAFLPPVHGRRSRCADLFADDQGFLHQPLYEDELQIVFQPAGNVANRIPGLSPARNPRPRQRSRQT